MIYQIIHGASCTQIFLVGQSQAMLVKKSHFHAGKANSEILELAIIYPLIR